jgi:hypothetical protein
MLIGALRLRLKKEPEEDEQKETLGHPTETFEHHISPIKTSHPDPLDPSAGYIHIPQPQLMAQAHTSQGMLLPAEKGGPVGIDGHLVRSGHNRIEPPDVGQAPSLRTVRHHNTDGIEHH